MSNLLKFFSFKGRIPRSQFWGVFYMLLLLAFLGGIPLAALVNSYVGTPTSGVNVDLIGFIVFILFVWVVVAATVKRFHDRDKSGLWVLISLSVVGILWIIGECGFMKGTIGLNRFGDDPIKNG